jgi:hypothetical protein
MYCVIKCVKTKRVLKHEFASSVFHNRNAKTQICVTGCQSVKERALCAALLVSPVISRRSISENVKETSISERPNYGQDMGPAALLPL